MYISLSMDPYKYTLTASVRLTSNPSETIRALSYKCPLYPTSFILWTTCPKLLFFFFTNNCNYACIVFSILTNNLFFVILPHLVVWDLHYFV